MTTSESRRSALTARLKAEALDLGFDAVGVTAVRPSDHAAFYREWLQAGHHGELAYLAREDAVERRLHPERAWPELRSAIVVAMGYAPGSGTAPPATPIVATSRRRGEELTNDASSPVRQGQDARAADGTDGPEAPDRGIVARYARGRDYHRVLRKRLLALLARIEDVVGSELPAARAYVDTGPVLERELARRAGLGWFGRNTMLIHPRRGSYFFLGSLLLEIELDEDRPFDADHCGRCTACTDACPTGALLGRDAAGAPVMDATRCISYLTIELRGPIPRPLRSLIGNRIFGCDICQEVCPWNGARTKATREPGRHSPSDLLPRGAGVPWRRDALPVLDELAATGWEAPRLIELIGMTEAEWDEFSRGSAIRRAKRAGFLRNVAVALGNQGSREAVPALAGALSDSEPLVRGHAAWALGRVGSEPARAALTARLATEESAWVREEITLALVDLDRRQGQRAVSGYARA